MDTKEEQVLASLINPDDPTGDNYRWDEELQKNILGMLLCDKNFLVQSFDLVKPEYFQNEVHKSVCKILFNYFNDYKSLPSKIVVREELKNLIQNKNPPTQVFYLSEFETVYNYYIPGVEDREYLLDQVTNFAKKQALKLAFSKCLDQLKNQKSMNDDIWGDIEDTLRAALTVDRNFEIGLDYFQTFEERYARMLKAIKDGAVFTCGFEAIDEALNGGLMPGEIGSWVGMSGTGKSLLLTKCAIANLRLGKKVLYVTLEIDQDRTAQRFDAQLVNRENHPDINVNNLQQHQQVLFESLKEYISDQEDPRTLIIKQFPSGSLDLSTLRAYFTQLGMYDFRPDLVIIDYVGEMKDVPGFKTHESRFKIVRDLRGFAVEEKFALLTAMQPAEGSGKEAQEVGEIDESNLGDSKAQIRPLDACWSINQTRAEKECGIARIFVIKHRFGKSKFKFYVKFDYNTLNYYPITREEYDRIIKTYQNEVKDRATDATAVDMVDKIVSGGAKKMKNFADKLSENFEGNTDE